MVVGGAGVLAAAVGVSVQMMCAPVQTPVREALSRRGRHGAIGLRERLSCCECVPPFGRFAAEYDGCGVKVSGGNEEGEIAARLKKSLVVQASKKVAQTGGVQSSNKQ